jgi:endonuclease III
MRRGHAATAGGRATTGGPHGPMATASPRAVAAVLRRLGHSLSAMDVPAVEKISAEHKGTAFQVLIATMLSAQTRDTVTLAASMRLFAAAPTVREMAQLSVGRIERLVRPVSFYRHKARHVKATCSLLLSRFGGEVPDTMDDLLALPGVGRKTANLVLIVAHGKTDNICVDTHVHRIANRLGWVTTRNAAETEQALYRVTPRRWWPSINLYLVTWGQNVCRPLYPRCDACVIRRSCARRGVERLGRAQVS